MHCKQNTHQIWMEKAIKIAKAVKDEVPVCALIIKDNNLISTAVNKIEKLHDATAHAEILAIRKATKLLGDWRLNNCTLYTTLEPCPMCAGAILNSRISKVVFGAYDINLGACGTVFNLFNELRKEKHVEIIGGVMEKENSELLKDFFKRKRKLT